MTPEETLPPLLRKLKALADHPNTPRHEAAIAREKLRRLMAERGITEDDLSDERPIEWMESFIQTHERDIFAAVLTMIMDTFTVLLEWRNWRGYWIATVRTPLIDQADIRAAFSWYRKYLNKDRGAMQDKVRAARAQVKALLEEVKTLNSGMRKLPRLMIGTYEIFPPTFLEEYNRERAQQAEAGAGQAVPAKPRKLTKKEEARLMKAAEARAAARRNMTAGHAWQKGAGLHSGQAQLEFKL